MFNPEVLIKFRIPSLVTSMLSGSNVDERIEFAVSEGATLRLFISNEYVLSGLRLQISSIFVFEDDRIASSPDLVESVRLAFSIEIRFAILEMFTSGCGAFSYKNVVTALYRDLAELDERV